MKFHFLNLILAFSLSAVALNAAALSLENVEFLLLTNNGKLVALRYRSTSSDEAANKYFYGNKAVAGFAFCKTGGKGIACSASREGTILRKYKMLPGDPWKYSEAKTIIFRSQALRPIGVYSCEEGCESDRYKTIVEVSTEP
jgi:hypothetical protein